MEESKYNSNEIHDPEVEDFLTESKKHTAALAMPTAKELEDKDIGTIADRMQRVRRDLVEGGLIDRHSAAAAEQEKERKDREFRQKLEKPE